MVMRRRGSTLNAQLLSVSCLFHSTSQQVLKSTFSTFPKSTAMLNRVLSSTVDASSLVCPSVPLVYHLTSTMHWPSTWCSSGTCMCTCANGVMEAGRDLAKRAFTIGIGGRSISIV
jgi:hypothetical protein